MRSIIITTVTAVSIGISGGAFAQAADGAGEFANPCEAAPLIDFDFWVGEWVAVDSNTGVVQGIDRIEKINNGCSLFQDWSQMTDRFRTAGAPYRYAGVSFNSVMSDGRWQQVWVGNGGGTIIVAGGLNEEGTMVLTSGELTASNGTSYDRTWYWDPMEDGTIHSWGENRTLDGDGTWSEPTVPWDLLYIPRADAPNLVAATEE